MACIQTWIGRMHAKILSQSAVAWRHCRGFTRHRSHGWWLPDREFFSSCHLPGMTYDPTFSESINLYLASQLSSQPNFAEIFSHVSQLNLKKARLQIWGTQPSQHPARSCWVAPGIGKSGSFERQKLERVPRVQRGTWKRCANN